MKKLTLPLFIRSVLAQPTGEIINIPVRESLDKLKQYSLFAGFVISLLTIAFILILYYIYRKRKLKKRIKR